MSVTSPAVSVVTPTQLSPWRLTFFRDLAADMRASGVDYEWIVIVDGDDDRELPEELVDDARTRRLCVGRHVGAAAARNLALGLARGRYVTSADDDDRLLPGSLRRRIEAAEREGVGWVAGPLVRLDGEVFGPSTESTPTAFRAARGPRRDFGRCARPL